MYMHNQNIVVFFVKAKEKVKGKIYVDQREQSYSDVQQLDHYCKGRKVSYK